MILPIFQSSIEEIAIFIIDDSIYQHLIEPSFFLFFWSIPNSFSLSFSFMKLSFINFIFFDLPAMKMLQPAFKLSDVLFSIWSQYSISIDLVIFPLSNIFDPVSIRYLGNL